MNAPPALRVGRKCSGLYKHRSDYWLLIKFHPFISDASSIPCSSLTFMAVPSNVSLSDSLKGAQRKAFYEGHKEIALIMILVVFLFPLFGVYISGLLGAAVGMIISLLAYFLTPYVTLKLGA